MKQTILVVEDDKMIRDLIRIYLEKENYHVVEAVDGEEAKSVYKTHRPCLIILDLMLPKVSGEEFCTWVRQEQRDELAIIMLSAKAQIDDKVAGLKMGADTYLTKPFDPDELTANVEAVLRRTGQTCEKITFNGLCIKPKKAEVLLYEKEVHLTKHEFNLLHYFMLHPNRVFSREELVLQIYPHDENSVMDRTIDVHIKKLRKKIEDTPAKPKRIITVRGMGYRFETK